MTTINDVAKRAGVSTTTVSHTINGTRKVSEELRERVFRAMEELDYRPNYLARGLRSGHTRMICLVVPDIANPFFAEISRAIEDAGYAKGYSVILANSDSESEKEESYVSAFISKQVDGVIFISAGGNSDTVRTLLDNKIPVVIADRELQGVETDIVLVDNHWGGYIATKHLIELGHQRIGCITGPSGLTPSSQRIEGYIEALREASLNLPPEYIQTGNFQFDSGVIAMQRLLALPQPPTAVFACNDMMAFGAIQAARDQHVRIPDDISVVGFDNISLAATMFPALTTVDQGLVLIAERVTELLIKRISLQNKDGMDDKPVKVNLSPQLIVRQSTAERRA